MVVVAASVLCTIRSLLRREMDHHCYCCLRKNIGLKTIFHCWMSMLVVDTGSVAVMVGTSAVFDGPE